MKQPILQGLSSLSPGSRAEGLTLHLLQNAQPLAGHDSRQEVRISNQSSWPRCPDEKTARHDTSSSGEFPEAYVGCTFVALDSHRRQTDFSG
jgi:hypothetical protein